MTIGPIVVAGDKVMLAEKELEIKLEGAPSAMRRLNGIPLIKALNKPPKRVTEVSVYFDTDKHKLRKNGLMLRVRRIGKRHVQTIKAAGNSAPIERDEWETQISGTRPDLSKIGGTPLESRMSNNVRLQLKPMFETRVHRTIYPLADDARSIELTTVRLRHTVMCGIRTERHSVNLQDGVPVNLLPWSLSNATANNEIPNGAVF